MRCILRSESEIENEVLSCFSDVATELKSQPDDRDKVGERNLAHLLLTWAMAHLSPHTYIHH